MTAHVEVRNMGDGESRVTVAFPWGDSGFRLEVDGPPEVGGISAFSDPSSGHNGIEFSVKTNLHC